MLARARFGAADRLALQAVAAVFPFRTNAYVVDELIDWDAAPDDPIFRLTFPQLGMLAPADQARMQRLLGGGAPAGEIRAAANEIRARLNPHPAGQVEFNEPTLAGHRVPGLQHKYAETVLIFPRPGQTCHAYCQYCFRWPQFVGEPALKIATDEVTTTVAYLKAHSEVTDVLLTGGDPMVMSSAVLRRHVEPLLHVEHLSSIRIGTKSLSYWPQRFVSDADTGDLLRLFEDVAAAGKHLAVMAHFSHPRELATSTVREAVRRIRATGAVIRAQAPLIRGVNDDPAIWADLWRESVHQSIVPYYMFVERDTGPQQHFAVPLERAYEIFRDAYDRVSGLARTVRGPVMSTLHGKVCIDGIADVCGEKVFVLRFLQSRDPGLVARPFFAQYDSAAIWLTDLKPALGATTLGP